MLWRDYEHTLNSPNWDSTAAKIKEILSTSSPPLTAPVEKLSSAFSVLKQMSTHFLAIRLKGWAMIILNWPWNVKSGEKVTEAPSSESGVALKHRLRKECTATWRSFTEADMSGLRWMDIYSAMTMQMVHSMKCPQAISSKSMFAEAYWGEIFTLSLNHFERLNDIFSKRFSFWRSQQIAVSVFKKLKGNYSVPPGLMSPVVFA